MDLRLVRTDRQPAYTGGELWLDGPVPRKLVETLEDPERLVKVFGDTAIPLGRYKVVLNMSNKFKRILPLLLDVPGYRGVRMHRGNKTIHTLGCPLVGLSRKGDTLFKSKDAEGVLMNVLRAVPQGEEIWITVVHGA